MNTKIQVLNSVDLENISGGMCTSSESCYGSSRLYDGSFRLYDGSSFNSENLKDFNDFLNGLVQPFGFVYNGNKNFRFVGNISKNIGNFSPAFYKNDSTSLRAGFLTAFATVNAVITGAVFGTYKGIKWAVKKIF